MLAMSSNGQRLSVSISARDRRIGLPHLSSGFKIGTAGLEKSWSTIGLRNARIVRKEWVINEVTCTTFHIPLSLPVINSIDLYFIKTSGRQSKAT